MEKCLLTMSREGREQRRQKREKRGTNNMLESRQFVPFTHTFISGDGGWVGGNGGHNTRETGTERQIWSVPTAGGVAPNVFVSHNATHCVISHHALCQLPLPPPPLAAQPGGGASGGGRQPAPQVPLRGSWAKDAPSVPHAETAAQVQQKTNPQNIMGGGGLLGGEGVGWSLGGSTQTLHYTKRSTSWFYASSSRIFHRCRRVCVASLWLDSYFR